MVQRNDPAGTSIPRSREVLLEDLARHPCEPALAVRPCAACGQPAALICRVSGAVLLTGREVAVTRRGRR
jgi:hypothetical protein